MCAVYIGSNPHPPEPSATDWAQLVDQTRRSNHLVTEVINMADRHRNFGICNELWPCNGQQTKPHHQPIRPGINKKQELGILHCLQHVELQTQ